MVQVLASARFAADRARQHGGALAPTTREGRLALGAAADGAEAATLASEVRSAESTKGGARAEAAARAGLRAYVFMPHRIELLHGGPDWPEGPQRFEWSMDLESSRWRQPQQILPYSEVRQLVPSRAAVSGS